MGATAGTSTHGMARDKAGLAVRVSYCRPPASCGLHPFLFCGHRSRPVMDPRCSDLYTCRNLQSIHVRISPSVPDHALSDIPPRWPTSNTSASSRSHATSRPRSRCGLCPRLGRPSASRPSSPTSTSLPKKCGSRLLRPRVQATSKNTYVLFRPSSPPVRTPCEPSRHPPAVEVRSGQERRRPGTVHWCSREHASPTRARRQEL